MGLGMRSKKIAEKEKLVHIGGRGGKKIPFFKFIKKGTYSYGERGQKLFVRCPMFNFVFGSPHNLWQFLMPYIMKIFYIT